jgi:hypothetical protein
MNFSPMAYNKWLQGVFLLHKKYALKKKLMVFILKYCPQKGKN